MNDFITDNQLLASLLLITGAIVIRWLAVRYFQKIASDKNELPKRWMNAVRNTITLLIVVGLIIIWLSELRFVALSIATFTVALIIATREFIQCFLGALYHTSIRAFSIGDWIKVGDHCGEVISSDWLTTRLLEVDIECASYGYTGKTIIVPNNQFVANPVYNFNFMRSYVSHTFTIVRDAPSVNIYQAKAFILEKAEMYCEPFKETTQNHYHLSEKRLGVRLSESTVSARVATTNLGKDQLTVSVFCPTKEAVKLEQKLTEDFMNFWYTEVERIKAEQEKK